MTATIIKRLESETSEALARFNSQPDSHLMLPWSIESEHANAFQVFLDKLHEFESARRMFKLLEHIKNYQLECRQRADRKKAEEESDRRHQRLIMLIYFFWLMAEREKDIIAYARESYWKGPRFDWHASVDLENRVRILVGAQKFGVAAAASAPWGYWPGSPIPIDHPVNNLFDSVRLSIGRELDDIHDESRPFGPDPGAERFDILDDEEKSQDSKLFSPKF